MYNILQCHTVNMYNIYSTFSETKKKLVLNDIMVC